MVIVPEAISEWIDKGEVVDRYYNPGDLFDHVDVVLTNDDWPDPGALQRVVGRAEVSVHSRPLPPGTFRRTLGYRPRLLRRWAAGVVGLARELRPDLVRCHGADVNALAASEVKRVLGVPYAVSLHINPDEDIRGRATDRRERIALRAIRSVERYSLRRADVVLPVYEPIVPYLKRLGVTRYEVAYNSLNGEHLRRKDDYALHEPVRVISVGRLFELKDPEQLMRAVATLDDVQLTIVGDGPLREHLLNVAAELDTQQIVFRRAVTNDELCELLAEQDLFATHTEHWEISKSVLEALLTGLPVVLNRRSGDPVPELSDEIAVLVDGNTRDDWAAALRRLIDDDGARERLGRRAGEHARARWSPEATESHFVEVYERLLGNAG
jgi:glycosyltransferase involved in cell wall biosynthesis